MITLNGVDLLIEANDALQEQSWATTEMRLTQVEQKGSTLVFYGTGLLSGDSAMDVELLENLDMLAQSLAKKYRLDQ